MSSFMPEIKERLPPADQKKVWTTLVTNTKYMEGVLTLHYSLQRVGSKYPLVILYTDSLEKEGHETIDARGLYKRHIKYLLPTAHKDYSADPRFYDCWSKLQPFSLVEFDRVGQLDSDMVAVRNMDELMEIPLDKENKVFAASHACVCNPYNKPSYPKDWIPENCPYSHYHKYKYEHDWEGPPCDSGLSMCNGGLQVVQPSIENFNKILAALESDSTSSYEFSDQSLLSDVFKNKWQPLSYKYNALKTLKLIHKDVWNDNEVKNIHYIISPKPWDDCTNFDDTTHTFQAWWKINDERLEHEKKTI